MDLVKPWVSSDLKRQYLELLISRQRQGGATTFLIFMESVAVTTGKMTSKNTESLETTKYIRVTTHLHDTQT